MGERKLKNVGRPVRVYRLNPDRLGSLAANAQRQPRAEAPRVDGIGE
jgi:hypothetical protein